MIPPARTNLLVCAVLVYAVPACTGSPTYEVHRAVSATVAHFAPGLDLSKSLGQNASRLSNRRWLQHAGVVGMAPRGLFVQARLYPAPEARAKAELQNDAPVRVIELVADNSSNDVSVQMDLAIAFRGVPKEGCLLLRSGDARQLRTVRYWNAPKGAGGVAVVSDFVTGTPVWSLIAWTGPFNGTETLMAPFEPRPCDGGNDPIALSNVARSVDAVAALQLGFADSVERVRTGVETARRREFANADAPDACEVPGPTVETTRHRLAGFSIELPADFLLVRSSPPYEWRAPDNSVVAAGFAERILSAGTGGSYKSHCETTISGRKAVIRIFNFSAYSPEMGVTTAFPKDNVTDLTVDAVGPSQERQRQFLRAAYSIEIDHAYGRQDLTRDNR